MSESSDEPRWRALLHSHQGIGLLVAAIAIVLDHAAKRAAFVELRPVGREFDLPGPVSFTLTFNDGGAFGLPAPAWLFGLVTIVVVVLVARVLPKVPTLSLGVAYGLLLGGALGNALDRLFADGPVGESGFFNGQVTDFIKIPFDFPIFNIADVAITAGFVVLVVAMFREEQREEARQAAAEAAAETATPGEDDGRDVQRTRVAA